MWSTLRPVFFDSLSCMGSDDEIVYLRSLAAEATRCPSQCWKRLRRQLTRWPGLPFTTAHPFSWTRLRVKQEDKPSAVVTYSIAADIEKWRWRGDICSLPDHFCPWWHIVFCILLTFYLSSSWTVHSLEMRNLATWFNLVEVLATLASTGGRSSIPTSAHTGGSFLCKTLSWNPDTLAKHIYRQHWRLQRGRKGPKM